MFGLTTTRSPGARSRPMPPSASTAARVMRRGGAVGDGEKRDVRGCRRRGSRRDQGKERAGGDALEADVEEPAPFHRRPLPDPEETVRGGIEHCQPGLTYQWIAFLGSADSYANLGDQNGNTISPDQRRPTGRPQYQTDRLAPRLGGRLLRHRHQRLLRPGHPVRRGRRPRTFLRLSRDCRLPRCSPQKYGEVSWRNPEGGGVVTVVAQGLRGAGGGPSAGS